MRVLQLGKYYYPYMGGIETHLYDLCSRLSRSDQVEAVVCHTEPRTIRENVAGVRVVRVASVGRAASMEICPTLPWVLSQKVYDLLHLHTPNPMGMMAYLLSRKPAHHALVVTHHSDIVRQAALRQALGPIFRRVMSRADAIIASSERYLETSEELRPYRPKCVVIPYGIDTTGRPISPAKVAELRARYGSRVVLGVGRLTYYKGFEVLLDAMAAVEGNLVVIGDGPLRQPLARKCQELGIADRVAFVGAVHNHEIPSYYAAADVFAFPSIARSEAFGIVQLEAMLAGLPVVNTFIDSGVPSVSIDRETGITVPPGEASPLAGALNELLASPELRRRYGEAGTRRVMDHFGADGMVRRVSELYRQVRHRDRGLQQAA